MPKYKLTATTQNPRALNFCSSFSFRWLLFGCIISNTKAYSAFLCSQCLKANRFYWLKHSCFSYRRSMRNIATSFTNSLTLFREKTWQYFSEISSDLHPELRVCLPTSGKLDFVNTRALQVYMQTTLRAIHKSLSDFICRTRSLKSTRAYLHQWKAITERSSAQNHHVGHSRISPLRHKSSFTNNSWLYK